uniref:Integrase zinc-binding domain-containing protein n=1 Tax=Trichogramma kaykai TaxID=54128 RepID=A0ABD2VX54_9HYME
MEELKGAQSRIRDRSAPGPDGVPNMALKLAIAARPDVFLRVYTTCLETGIFPSSWKRQRLVLLPKPGKPPDEPSSYRPLYNVVADALSRISPTNLDSNDRSSKLEAPAHKKMTRSSRMHKLSQVSICSKSSSTNTRVGATSHTDPSDLYLPAKLRRVAYEIKHLPAHPGVKATDRALAESFVWPGVPKKVSTWTRCCTACQLSKISRHNRSDEPVGSQSRSTGSNTSTLT